MSDDLFFGVKKACREAGQPRGFSRVFRAIREGSYPGEVHEGERGKEVRLSEVRAFLEGGGAGDGAGAGTVENTGEGPGHGRHRTEPNRRTTPKQTTRVPAPRSPATAAMRDALEIRQLERSLHALDAAEGAAKVQAEIALEEARRRWRLEDEDRERARRREQLEAEERERLRRREEREVWLRGWRLHAEAWVAAARELVDEARFRAALLARVELRLLEMWPSEAAPKPPDDLVERSLNRTFELAFIPFVEELLEKKKRERAQALSSMLLMVLAGQRW